MRSDESTHPKKIVELEICRQIATYLNTPTFRWDGKSPPTTLFYSTVQKKGNVGNDPNET